MRSALMWESCCRAISRAGRDLSRVIDLEGWKKSDGSFRSRQLLLGWDNTPMHRWAQSQLFRSLCFFLYRNIRSAETKSPGRN